MSGGYQWLKEDGEKGLSGRKRGKGHTEKGYSRQVRVKEDKEMIFELSSLAWSS